MIAPARKAAFELLLELKRKPESHSDVLLRSQRVETLSAADKNLATALVMGVLRWQLVLQQRIREALTKRGHLADAVQVSLRYPATGTATYSWNAIIAESTPPSGAAR